MFKISDGSVFGYKTITSGTASLGVDVKAVEIAQWHLASPTDGIPDGAYTLESRGCNSLVYRFYTTLGSLQYWGRDNWYQDDESVLTLDSADRFQYGASTTAIPARIAKGDTLTESKNVIEIDYEDDLLKGCA